MLLLPPHAPSLRPPLVVRQREHREEEERKQQQQGSQHFAATFQASLEWRRGPRDEPAAGSNRGRLSADKVRWRCCSCLWLASLLAGVGGQAGRESGGGGAGTNQSSAHVQGGMCFVRCVRSWCTRGALAPLPDAQSPPVRFDQWRKRQSSLSAIDQLRLLGLYAAVLSVGCRWVWCHALRGAAGYGGVPLGGCRRVRRRAMRGGAFGTLPYLSRGADQCAAVLSGVRRRALCSMRQHGHWSVDLIGDGHLGDEP